MKILSDLSNSTGMSKYQTDEMGSLTTMELKRGSPGKDKLFQKGFRLG